MELNIKIIPKPVLKKWDETSLTLEISGFSWDENIETLYLEFKEPPVSWSDAKSVTVQAESGTVKYETEILDLKPGTPYFVRFCLKRGEEKTYGPDAVFDTLPVDCTPKRKKCSIM